MQQGIHANYANGPYIEVYAMQRSVIVHIVMKRDMKT
jgi:hypothetical protein